MNRSGERQNQKTNDELIVIVQRLYCYFKELIIYGNRTEWSPTYAVLLRVIIIKIERPRSASMIC